MHAIIANTASSVRVPHRATLLRRSLLSVYIQVSHSSIIVIMTHPSHATLTLALKERTTIITYGGG